MNKRNEFPFLDYYLVFSLVMSLILWQLVYFNASYDFGKLFFPSAFVLFNFFYATRAFGYTEVLQRDGRLNIYLLIQSALLLAFGLEVPSAHDGHLYLSILPILFGMGILYRNHFLGRRPFHPKVIAMAVIFLITHKVIESLWVHNIKLYDYSIFLVFCLWSMGITYLLGHLSMLERKSFLFKLRNIKESDDMVIPVANDDRMFYHDVINHTHGILLFLNNKKCHSTPISDHENHLLIKEVENLQSIMKEHFNHYHRNVGELEEYISFNQAKEVIEKSIFNYIPRELTHLTYRGYLKTGFNGQGEACMIYLPYFNRILINLVKNIKDHGKSEYCEFIFDGTDEEIILTIKNKIFNINSSKDLAEELKFQILSSNNSKDTNDEGLGLESVSTLAKLLGGSFSFNINQGYWTSIVRFKASFQAYSEVSERLDKVS